jgi:hypothetical protein
MSRLLNEPVLIGTLIRQAILLVSLFGVAISDAQTAAIIAFVDTVLLIGTRMLVTPNQLAIERVDRQLEAGKQVTPSTAITPRP